MAYHTLIARFLCSSLPTFFVSQMRQTLLSRPRRTAVVPSLHAHVLYVVYASLGLSAIAVCDKTSTALASEVRLRLLRMNAPLLISLHLCTGRPNSNSPACKIFCPCFRGFLASNLYYLRAHRRTCAEWCPSMFLCSLVWTGEARAVRRACATTCAFDAYFDAPACGRALFVCGSTHHVSF